MKSIILFLIGLSFSISATAMVQADKLNDQRIEFLTEVMGQSDVHKKMSCALVFNAQRVRRVFSQGPQITHSLNVQIATTDPLGSAFTDGMTLRSGDFWESEVVS